MFPSPHCYSQKCESSAHWKKMRENRQMHCQQTHCKHSSEPNGHTCNKWKENTRRNANEKINKQKTTKGELPQDTQAQNTALIFSLCLLLFMIYNAHPLFMLMSWANIVKAQGEQPSYCKGFYVCVCAYVRMTKGRPTVWTHLNFLSIKNVAGLSTLVLDRSSRLQHLVPFMNWQRFSLRYALLSFYAGHTHLKYVSSDTWYCHTASS